NRSAVLQPLLEEPTGIDEPQLFFTPPMFKNPAFGFMEQLGVQRSPESPQRTHASDRRLSQAVIQKFKMFILLADTSSDAYFLKDLSFKYVYVNSAMERLLNLPRSQIVGVG